MAVEQLPKETKQQIAELGYGLAGDIGGQHKQRYWTPDGREILTQPSLRTYIKKENGKVVESGVRDANLDKGWLSQPPTNPKLRCFHCDRWHDTKEEIDQCGAKKKAFDTKYMKRAKKDVGKNGDEVAELRNEMSEMKELLEKLLEKGND